MLEPRGADIPILFLVLVVLPVVAYILLGRWSDISEKRGRANLLAQMAAEEAFRAETASRSVRFENMATETRAHRTRTKTVPAGSGSVRAEFVAEQRPDSVAATCGVPVNTEGHVCARCLNPAKTRCSRCKSIRYCSGKCQIIHWRLAHKDECVPVETCSSSSERVSFENDSVLHDSCMDSCTMYSDNNTKQTAKGKTSKSSVEFASAGISQIDITPRINTQGRKSVGKPNSSKSNRESFSGEAACAGGDSKKGHTRHKSRSSISAVETNSRRHSVDNSSMQMNGQTFESGIQERCENNLGARSSLGTRTATLPKSGEQSCTETSKKGQAAALSKTARSKDTCIAEESNGISSSMGSNLMKMMGLRNSTKHDKNLKMLFPYEEFVKFFQCEVFYLSPRGLVNCGNSCYANAVLQSLTCTKPLVAYLLGRSHSRSCSGKDWCLMCELEQHVMMLRESGGPLSASRILSHMRSINCQIGDGSQEDAHEFLRLLVASMQSICLERLGGETKVDPRLQETTLVQHMFGGRLRSKVKCLRCDHESERYENIMDLTLEIYGWVESLQDALTQFTRPEDLDGENMYRCSRCAGYVRARKELSIHEAPNILTIVLKRFQEGRYGKINKCISFPEMLDMIPFMTRTGDVPPLYMLYAVIVHLDTLNASFSGHYISYVKDLRGNWFRIDDSEIHQVPMTQVMSEGAYMLFYMRSYPRPQRGEHNGKAQVRHPQPRNEMKEPRKPVNRFKPRADYYNKNLVESSSSEWSLFTSSDEAASFTTESTRDSFSTVDYTDGCHVLDSSSSPFPNIFHNLYHNNNNVEPSPHNTVACRMFSGTKPETRYFVEEEETNHNNNTVVMEDSSSHGYYQQQSMYVVDYETNCQEQTYSYEQNW
ncbi:Ubiquitin carboxyl-terminal hydrolase 15 [Hirschfeldia incana]|nr:Ubiquitin carboxyl-terminal hydrolase 15 [Hirschfeldia incana]